jgi:TetR/AcrR family transcriptional repressor of nem operon
MQGPAAPLQRAGAGRAEIEATLRAVIDHAVSARGQRGCFANNCLAEVAPHDPQVMQATRAVVRRLEQALLRAVEQGQRDGAIAAAEQPQALARFLVNTLSGINLAAKAKPGRARLDDIARVALRALD